MFLGAIGSSKVALHELLLITARKNLFQVLMNLDLQLTSIRLPRSRLILLLHIVTVGNSRQAAPDRFRAVVAGYIVGIDI